MQQPCAGIRMPSTKWKAQTESKPKYWAVEHEMIIRM